jgi:hypothetical protein
MEWSGRGSVSALLVGTLMMLAGILAIRHTIQDGLPEALAWMAT